MTRERITFSEAQALATRSARRVLRGLFPRDESEVFEDYVLEDVNFWLFFRSRQIAIPDHPNGKISDDCAFAVSKYGLALNVVDNLDDREKLDAQVAGLSGYFARRDK